MNQPKNKAKNPISDPNGFTTGKKHAIPYRAPDKTNKMFGIAKYRLFGLVLDVSALGSISISFSLCPVACPHFTPIPPPLPAHAPPISAKTNQRKNNAFSLVSSPYRFTETGPYAACHASLTRGLCVCRWCNLYWCAKIKVMQVFFTDIGPAIRS